MLNPRRSDGRSQFLPPRVSRHEVCFLHGYTYVPFWFSMYRYVVYTVRPYYICAMRNLKTTRGRGSELTPPRPAAPPIFPSGSFQVEFQRTTNSCLDFDRRVTKPRTSILHPPVYLFRRKGQGARSALSTGEEKKPTSCMLSAYPSPFNHSRTHPNIKELVSFRTLAVTSLLIV
jgi:hypothetical protein